MTKYKRFTYITMLSAMAIIINVLEGVFLPPVAFGFRLGLANIIALLTLQLLDIKAMLIVNTNRVLLGNILRGTIFGSTFWVSAGGVVLSSIVLAILHKFKASIVFKSIISALAHSFGQILVIMYLYQQIAMLGYLPILMLASLITGIFTGILAFMLDKRVLGRL